MLVKKSDHQARRSSLARLAAHTSTLDRRAFLRRSGIAAGSLAALGTIPLDTVRKAEAAAAGPLTAGALIRKSVCTHCSVGCTVTAEVANGVWIGQEPSWIRRLIAARIARKAPRCANSLAANDA